MPAEAVKYIGDKLCVGPVDFSFLPSIPAFPGTTVLNGPVWIGAGLPAVPVGNCMIGPGLISPVSLHVIGINNFVAVTNQIGLFTCTGASIFNGTNTLNGVSIFNASVTVNASHVINGSLVVNGSTNINGFLTFTSSIVGVTKSFDIKHPTKEGYRLKYGCLEGPEYGVYYRGKLKNTNIIKLPEYWKDLVNLETITVSLTSHTYYQQLYVSRIVGGDVIEIGNNSGGQIDCSYIIFAERKDVKKLLTEYEGTEPKENSDIDMEE
jgi:hypothetical protein